MLDNRTIALRLVEQARALDAGTARGYRPRAYRRAAETILGLDCAVAHIVDSRGRQGLRDLPGIGRHLAYAIAGLVWTGQFRTLAECGV